MSLLNIALIAVGPFAVVGSVALAARLGTRISEKDAEMYRRLGELQVRQTEGN